MIGSTNYAIKMLYQRCCLLCEMAAYEKDKGRACIDKLIDLYVQYGFYKEHLISITKKGMNGQTGNC